MKEMVDRSVTSFWKDNEHFRSEFEIHLGIIRRFDEVLTSKASKISMHEIEDKIKRELEPEIRKMYSLIKSSSDEVEN